jgi:hypothetical protein
MRKKCWFETNQPYSKAIHINKRQSLVDPLHNRSKGVLFSRGIPSILARTSIISDQAGPWGYQCGRWGMMSISAGASRGLRGYCNTIDLGLGEDAVDKERFQELA